MIKVSDIKPIPKRILEKIHKIDLVECPTQKGIHRLYSYLTTIKGELYKVTVATKTFYGKWHCKQIAVHGVKSDICWTIDIVHHRISGYIVSWKSEGYKQHKYHWWADGEWHDNNWSKGLKWNLFSRTINIEYADKFPEFRYSAFRKFQGDCIITYLRIYLKYPQVEYLLLHRLEWLYNKVTILKKMGKDRSFCRWLVRKRDEICGDCHYAGVILESYRTGKPMTEIQKFAERKKRFERESHLQPIRDLFRKDLEKFFAYIDKQGRSPSSYLDYLTACDYLDLDMTLAKNRLPHDFKRWHDIRIDQYNTAVALAKEKESEELRQKFAIVAQKYLILQKQGLYAVLIAKSHTDLIHEGEQLKHCVGTMNYQQKIVREETLVFFIRAVENPDVPFVTIEYSIASRKVLQCYGYDSKKPDETVLTFVHNVWLPYANKLMKKIRGGSQ